MADLVGWLAAVLTLLTFSMRSMAALRVAAIGANLCFIAYGLIGGLVPVLVLHLVLLPCNALRLMQLYCAGDRPIDCPRPAATAEARCAGRTASRKARWKFRRPMRAVAFMLAAALALVPSSAVEDHAVLQQALSDSPMRR